MPRHHRFFNTRQLQLLSQKWLLINSQRFENTKNIHIFRHQRIVHSPLGPAQKWIMPHCRIVMFSNAFVLLSGIFFVLFFSFHPPEKSSQILPIFLVNHVFQLAHEIRLFISFFSFELDTRALDLNFLNCFYILVYLFLFTLEKIFQLNFVIRIKLFLLIKISKIHCTSSWPAQLVYCLLYNLVFCSSKLNKTKNGCTSISSSESRRTNFTGMSSPARVVAVSKSPRFGAPFIQSRTACFTLKTFQNTNNYFEDKIKTKRN